MSAVGLELVQGVVGLLISPFLSGRHDSEMSRGNEAFSIFPSQRGWMRGEPGVEAWGLHQLSSLLAIFAVTMHGRRFLQGAILDRDGQLGFLHLLLTIA